MKLNTKSRYATRAMLELARHYGEGPILLKEVSAKQQISLQYLEHIVRSLVTAGLVNSSRGVNGGVWLARPPSEIKLAEAVQAVEGDTSPVDCVMNPSACQRSRNCATRDVWSDVKDAIDGVLASVTLEDLLQRQKAKETPADNMYQI